MDGQVAARVKYVADVFAELRRMMSLADVAALSEMFRGGDGPYLVTFNGRHIVRYVKVPREQRADELALPHELADEDSAAEVEVGPAEATALPSPDGGGRRGRAKR